MHCFRTLLQADFSSCITKLNGFNTKDEQDIYLQQLIEKKYVRSHRPRKEDSSISREYSFKYFIELVTKKQVVCKKAFCSIYGVTNARVKRLLKLKSRSITPHDRRGKHPKKNTIPPNVLKKIHDHIMSFPRKQTHYSGRHMEYLDTRLDVKTMFLLFKAKYPDLGIKYKFYIRYFKENFSLRFGRPQVDTCITCEELMVKIKNSKLGDHAKRAAEAELTVHKRRSKKFHNKISEIQELCKSRDDVAALTFDFMQNLPLPNIPIQEIFYLRQLWVNCFGIKNLKTGKSVFYVYHEGIANKGSNEICSILLHYFDNFLDGNIKELFLFSDNCPGQNKNHTVIRFLTALTDTERFNNIKHYFPIRGHSFLPNDRDFGVVKRKIKKHDRIYVPDEYYNIIANASKEFAVFMLQSNQIYDFVQWWPQYYKKTCLSIESVGKGVPKSVMYFEYNKNQMGVILTRNFIDGITSHSFPLLRNMAQPISFPPPEKAYPRNCVSINPKKIENIRQVQNSILEEHKGFYENILRWPTNEDNIEEAENDLEFDYVP